MILPASCAVSAEVSGSAASTPASEPAAAELPLPAAAWLSAALPGFPVPLPPQAHSAVMMQMQMQMTSAIPFFVILFHSFPIE